MNILRIEDVAELLKVKKSTLYSWVHTGSIPSFKLNGLVRFDKEKIERWIQESMMVKKESNIGAKKRKGNQNIDMLIKRAIQSEK